MEVFWIWGYFRGVESCVAHMIKTLAVKAEGIPTFIYPSIFISYFIIFRQGDLKVSSGISYLVSELWRSFEKEFLLHWNLSIELSSQKKKKRWISCNVTVKIENFLKEEGQFWFSFLLVGNILSSTQSWF